MNDYSSTWDATWNSTKDERCLELIAVSAQATSGGKADKVSATLAAGGRIPLSSARRGKRAKALQKRRLRGGSVGATPNRFHSRPSWAPSPVLRARFRPARCDCVR